MPLAPAALRKVTIGVVVGSVALLVGYDVAVYALGGSEATISDVVTSASFAAPIIPFALGVLVGHWLWTGKPTEGK